VRHVAGLAAALALVAAVPAVARAAAPGVPGIAWMPSASLHGQPVQRPGRPPRLGHAAHLPKVWHGSPLRLWSGYSRQSGWSRVRDVQRLLRRLGYRPGPVDGLFGPRTQAATGWFQYAHGLPTTGVVNATTLAVLRHPKRVAARTRPTRPASAPAPASGPQTAPAPATAPATAPAVTPETGWLTVPVLIILALLAAAGGAASVAWRLRRRRVALGASAPAASAVEPADEPTPAPSRPAPAPEPVRAAVAAEIAAPAAVAYTTLAPEERHGGVPHETTAAVQDLCARRGWSLLKVVPDVRAAGGRLADRPGLSYALRQIAEGAASRLVVVRLRDLTGAVSDLGPLLTWLRTVGASLVALDLDLDTATPEGAVAARTLVEVSDWEQRRIAERTRNGLTAARAPAASRTRRAVRDDPQLAARIAAMRADGKSLYAIADALNAEGVPTLRGGRQWRPSSVQAAVGYKRPGARQRGRAVPTVGGRSGGGGASNGGEEVATSAD
jgi:DNA invertase Pin-like site-specific DNA recombinase